MAKKDKKYYTLKISKMGLCFWIVGAIFVLVWMFGLGVFVGQEVIYIPNLPQIKLPSFPLNPRVQKPSPTSIKPKVEEIKLDKKAENKEIKPQEKTSSKERVKLKREVEGHSLKKEAPQYIFRVGTFKNKRNAQVLRKRLQNQGYKSYIKPIKYRNTTYYRVYVGPYELNDALSYFLELKRFNPTKPTPVP